MLHTIALCNDRGSGAVRLGKRWHVLNQLTAWIGVTLIPIARIVLNVLIGQSCIVAVTLTRDVLPVHELPDAIVRCNTLGQVSSSYLGNGVRLRRSGDCRETIVQLPFNSVYEEIKKSSAQKNTYQGLKSEQTDCNFIGNVFSALVRFIATPLSTSNTVTQSMTVHYLWE